MRRHNTVSYLVATVLAVVMMFSLSACGGTTATKDDCFKDLDESIRILIDNEDPEYTSFDEYKTKITESASAELEPIEKYDGAKFEDKGIGNVVTKYVEATRSKVEGAEYLLSDAAKFNEMYYEKGLNVQIECINTLMDDYDFDMDDDYSDDLSMLAVSDKVVGFAEGETISLETIYGTIEMTVAGYRYRANAAHQYEGDLLCTIKNVDYDVETTMGYVNTEEFLSVTDPTGAEIPQLGGAFMESVDGYECSPGYVDVANGETTKRAITFQQENECKYVCVTLTGESEIYKSIIAVK